MSNDKQNEAAPVLGCDRLVRVRLSPTQEWVLNAVAEGRAMRGCNRQADYGGRVTTLWSLKRKALVEMIAGEWVLSEKGKDHLAHSNV